MKLYRGYLYAGGIWKGSYTNDVATYSTLSGDATLVVRYGLDGTLDPRFFVYYKQFHCKLFDIHIDLSSNKVMNVGSVDVY